MEVREATATTDDLVRHVRDGVAQIVRDALEEAERVHEEANETLARYDSATGELAALKLERHSLKHDVADLPQRVHVAALDGLVDDHVGEDAEGLQRRYIQARERLPVAEGRIGRLEEELARLTSGGSRPAKINPQGGERRIVKHNSREGLLDVLNEAATALETLHAKLPDVVKDATAPLVAERDRVRAGQNDLWGQAKAPR